MSPPLVEPLEWVTIKTTLPKPYPPMAERQPIRTNRLILRSYTPTDLDDFHKLRIQPEVMKWTSQGVPDTDINQTSSVLDKRLPGSDSESTYQFAVCWAETGEMIGTAGSHLRKGELGWPVIGYMIRSEFWGKGLATELVTGFLQRYWSLPREEAEIEVDKSTVDSGKGHDELRPECIVGITLDGNEPSQNVLRKTGFGFAKLWEEEVDGNGGVAKLYGYAAKKPDDANGAI